MRAVAGRPGSAGASPSERRRFRAARATAGGTRRGLSLLRAAATSRRVHARAGPAGSARRFSTARADSFMNPGAALGITSAPSAMPASSASAATVRRVQHLHRGDAARHERVTSRSSMDRQHARRAARPRARAHRRGRGSVASSARVATDRTAGARAPRPRGSTRASRGRSASASRDCRERADAAPDNTSTLPRAQCRARRDRRRHHRAERPLRRIAVPSAPARFIVVAASYGRSAFALQRRRAAPVRHRVRGSPWLESCGEGC